METKYGYGYVRVSTDKQEELSPDSQAKLLKDFAHKNGIIISKIFYELGVSGRKAEKRPEFQKMIAMAKSSDHPVDAILVWSSVGLPGIRKKVSFTSHCSKRSIMWM